MVVSKIDKTVHYVENKKIDEEDRGFATSLFEIEILGKDVVIGLGKEKHTYQHKNIVFFPIYLVANNEIKSKIGVYEMKSTDVISSLDEDGDINIEPHEPLLFTFVKPRFLEKSGSSPDYYYNKAINEPPKPKPSKASGALISNTIKINVPPNSPKPTVSIPVTVPER